MLTTLFTQYSPTFQSIQILLLLLNAVLHIIFAGGVAHDIGALNRNHIPTRFVGGYAWILATLLGGILVLVAYWLIHHSALAKRS